MVRHLQIGLVLANVAVAGCNARTGARAVYATEAQLVARAAFDLGCPPAHLQLYLIDVRSRGVAGCARRGTYVEDCDAADRCTWVLDALHTDAAAPQAIALEALRDRH